MAKKKKIAYWLLPAAALCVASVAMSVGESQARYTNSVSWNTVAEPAKFTVTSNYLGNTSEPPVTVLLGQKLQESWEMSFVLNSSAGVSGALTWEADQPEYLTVQAKAGDTPLSSGDTVSLEGDQPVTVTMTLTPTQKAADLQSALDVNIRVEWSDALAGTFRLELPAAGENTPPEQTEPEATEAEVTQPETTEPEATEAEPTEPETSQTQPAITLEGFKNYHPDLMFPILISSPTDIHTQLNLLSGESVTPFPQGTRFSLDEGKSWFMLYQEGGIVLDMPAGEKQIVMLDLSETTLATEPSVTITAGENTVVTLTASTQSLFWMNSQVLTRDTEIVVIITDLWQDCELIGSVDMLVSTENGKQYVPAEISPEGLMAEIIPGDGKQQLSIRIGGTLPPPGTYRLNLSWHYKGICIWQNQTGFFINYSGNTITNQTGGDLQ